MTSYRRQLGLTAIELMATLLIVAVVVGIAIPNFASMIRSDRARAQAGLLADALNYARSEAVTRGVQVGVSSYSGNNWNLGWRVFVDANADNVYTAADTELRVQNAFSGTATLQSSAAATANTTILFSPTGSLTGVPNMVGNEVVFEYRADATNSSNCNLNKNISINLVGRISLGCP